MIEKIILTLISFIFFVYVFLFKMIKRNDTNYFVILGIQTIGILINFMQILFKILTGTVFNILIYLFSIVIPILVFLLEYKNINVSELIYLFCAKFHIFTNNNKKAKEILIKLVSKYPSYYGHKMLAEIYEKEGGMRKSIDEYVKALDIKKDDYKSYHKIAVLLNDLGKKDESIEILQNLLKTKPEHYEGSLLLGELLLEKEEFKKAINVLNTAIKHNEDKKELIYNLGIAYTRINEFALAIECYKKVVELDNNYYNAYFRLGQIALLYREFDNAENYFSNSLYQEKEAKSYFELTKINIIKNRKDKAALTIKQAIESDYRYYETAKNEPMFFTIKQFIIKPEKENIPEYNETEKEKQIEKYLNDTYNLTRVLNKSEEIYENNRFKWNKN